MIYCSLIGHCWHELQIHCKICKSKLNLNVFISYSFALLAVVIVLICIGVIACQYFKLQTILNSLSNNLHKDIENSYYQYSKNRISIIQIKAQLDKTKQYDYRVIENK